MLGSFIEICQIFQFWPKLNNNNEYLHEDLDVFAHIYQG